MNVPLHLGPGSRVPTWIEDIDQVCFGQPWGPLEEDEHLWADFPSGFARWRLIPAAQEAELLRFGVAVALRRAGRGRALLRFSQAKLASFGVQVLYLEVRVGNRAARSLYESEGWVFQGLRKSYYRDGEDAAIYRHGA